MKDSFECPRCGHCCAVDEWEGQDNVNHPKHYTSHPSGVECIEITEHMNFNLGNAMKYVWRASLKGNEVEDLKKAIWYLEREIARIG
jgi:Fe-S-cluster containining protein